MARVIKLIMMRETRFAKLEKKNDPKASISLIIFARKKSYIQRRNSGRVSTKSLKSEFNL